MSAAQRIKSETYRVKRFANPTPQDLGESLFVELDKGIDDWKNGRMDTHENVMRRLRERILTYAI